MKGFDIKRRDCHEDTYCFDIGNRIIKMLSRETVNQDYET